jgi:hypothetical protein
MSLLGRALTPNDYLFAALVLTVDFCFNNSVLFLAFVVVAAIALISLVILARDILGFFTKRLGKNATRRPTGGERWDNEHEEPWK